MLFLDLEKAFDRVSHTYLMEALKAAGLGKNMRLWIQMIYNPDDPMRRRVAVNGKLSTEFPILAGVAQGCPLSPLLFLFVAEALNRLIRKDSNLTGVRIGREEYKLSQFADDTVIFLEGFTGVQYLFETILPAYERATGMKVNTAKTEGLLLGALRRVKKPPANIRWCKEGEWIISLGVPIGNNFNELEFWRQKYRKCKALLAGWKDLNHVTPWGRAMLANNMVLSRFRYWAQVMHVPTEIMQSIASDVQALIWNKECDFNKEEEGTSLRNLPWVSKEARNLPSKEGGLSLLNWTAHVKALQVKTWLQYRDGNRGEWKPVLDQWVCRFFEQRGAPFSTVATEYILAPLSTRGSALPKFYKTSMKSLKELHLTPIKHNSYTDAEEARAEPLWCSHRHNIKVPNAWDWRKHLHTNRVNDLVNHDTEQGWTRNELQEWFNEHLQQVSPTTKKFFRLPQDIFIPTPTIDALIADFNKIVKQIGPETIKYATGSQTLLSDSRYSSQARRVMSSCGWKDPLLSSTFNKRFR